MAVAQPLIDCGPASSLSVWSAPGVNEGASLTELTVRRKVSVMLPVAVAMVTVIVAVPNRLAAGVRCSVRLPPVPVKTRLALGTRVVLLDVAVRLVNGTVAART